MQKYTERRKPSYGLGVVTHGWGLEKSDLDNYEIDALGNVAAKGVLTYGHSLLKLVGNYSLAELAKQFIEVKIAKPWVGQDEEELWGFFKYDEMIGGFSGGMPQAHLTNLGKCKESGCGASTDGYVKLGALKTPHEFGPHDAEDLVLSPGPLCNEHLFNHYKAIMEDGVTSDPYLENLYASMAYVVSGIARLG